MSFPEFHVDWMSPEEVYLHRENTSSQLYRGKEIHTNYIYNQNYTYIVSTMYMVSCATYFGNL